jgi:hypothetical protein
MLNASSPTYAHTHCKAANYYYQAIQVIVNQTLNYILFAKSNIKIYGYIHNNSFDPNNPSIGELLSNSIAFEDGQFTLFVHLQSNTTYILIVTTYDENKTGEFSVISSGPSNVTFKHLRKYIFTISLITIEEKQNPRKCFYTHSLYSGLDYSNSNI